MFSASSAKRFIDTTLGKARVATQHFIEYAVQAAGIAA